MINIENSINLPKNVLNVDFVSLKLSPFKKLRKCLSVHLVASTVLVMFRNLRKSPEILGKCCDGFVNPGHDKAKISCFELEKADK